MWLAGLGAAVSDPEPGPRTDRRGRSAHPLATTTRLPNRLLTVSRNTCELCVDLRQQEQDNRFPTRGSRPGPGRSLSQQLRAPGGPPRTGRPWEPRDRARVRGHGGGLGSGCWGLQGSPDLLAPQPSQGQLAGLPRSPHPARAVLLSRADAAGTHPAVPAPGWPGSGGRVRVAGFCQHHTRSRAARQCQGVPGRPLTPAAPDRLARRQASAGGEGAGLRQWPWALRLEQSRQGAGTAGRTELRPGSRSPVCLEARCPLRTSVSPPVKWGACSRLVCSQATGPVGLDGGVLGQLCKAEAWSEPGRAGLRQSHPGRGPDRRPGGQCGREEGWGQAKPERPADGPSSLTPGHFPDQVEGQVWEGRGGVWGEGSP